MVAAWMALATYSTLPVLRPATEMRPSLVKYTAESARIFRTSASDMPEKQNMPICDVTCDQSLAEPSPSRFDRRAYGEREERW